MQRTIASLPESVRELCLVRLGLVVKRWTAWPYARRLGRAIERAAVVAKQNDAGLLHAEPFAMGRGHFGVLQYWRSFDDLDAWSHRPPHVEWWREAVDRMRRKEDFGVYHEAFLVARENVESIYLNCPAIGLGAFGVMGEPVGTLTTSRDRLGRRTGSG